jgi:hypothetical protein
MIGCSAHELVRQASGPHHILQEANQMAKKPEASKKPKKAPKKPKK